MNIKPFDATIRSLLESGFYKIPRFQRPYSWESEHVADFWDDAVVSDDPDYFIGSFVVYKDKSQDDLSYIVDGQQRLTTITLLFAAIRDTLLKLGREPLAVGLHKLIERPDINNDLQFVLQSETPYPFLQEYIQKLGDPEVPEEVGAEEQALKGAYKSLLSRLERVVRGIELDPRIPAEEKSDLIRDALLEIRDKILRLKLIVVELDNDDDAYLIFETLNTRGKDLTTADLVKNYLTRLLRPRNKGVDTAKEKWIGIQKRFDEAAVDIDINSFLLHSWLSRFTYTSQKRLFKEIKGKVNRTNANAFLNNLVADSKLYRQIMEPSAFQWSKQEYDLVESLRSLMLFRVAQPIPMMLAVLRNYREGQISLKQATNVFGAMERFHVQFTAVTSQRTGGGTSQMYASSARQLQEARDANERVRVLREFINKMRERVPAFEEFDINFRELYYASTSTKDRALIRYLLTRLDQHWRRKDDAVDYSRLTIEHIAPESYKDHWEDTSSEFIGRIGNLILVPQDLNNDLANKPFGYKIAKLKERRVPMDDLLAQAEEWNNEQIEARSKELARIAYEEIFKV